MTSDRLQTSYRKFGQWIGRHSNLVIVLWAAVLFFAAILAGRAPMLLDASTRPLAGTVSAAVDAELASEFSNPFTQSLALVFDSTQGNIDSPEFRKMAQDLAASLRRCPDVARVLVPDKSFGSRFRAKDGKSTAILIGLKASSTSESQRMVPLLRIWVRVSLPKGLQGWSWKLTGQSAVMYDLNMSNAEDSRRAELRALPLTLMILLWVFGSLVSGGLPISLGIGSTLCAMGIVTLFSHLGSFHILYQNMVSLLGLALGIDYSLFILSRYREVRRKGLDPEKALGETLASTGVAVTWSGLTVFIGLAGLLFTPFFEIRSMGLGGMVVVAISLALSLSLLPAFLIQLDPWLRSPRWLSRLLEHQSSQARWKAWSGWIMKAPFLFLMLGFALLLLMSWPLRKINPGFPNVPWFPSSMESEQGLEILRQMGQSQELTPIDLIVSAEPGKPLLPAHLDDLFRLSAQLKKDPRVARLFGPVDLKDDLQEFQYRMIYLNLDQSLQEHPELGEMILSHNREKALLQIVLKDNVDYNAGKAYVRELSTMPQGRLKIQVGGHWAFTNDYDQVMLRAYPVIVGSVMLVTLLALFVAFRSYVVPLKALLLNLLSVSAALGALVAVFQWGWCASWIGLSGPIGAIPVQLPLLVFCITFGLSMDYEVLILSRVREEYLKDQDPEASVRQGIAATGGLISGAAAIMVVVFGAFALGDVILVKMLGFGLAVAVGLDALVVRAMMVPAAMRLAGKWNWYPGIKEK